MANCSCFSCFGRKERVSTPDPQQTSSSSPSLDEAQLEALASVNDVTKADELIQIIREFLEKRRAEKSVQDKAESSQSVASPFIDIGANFFNFFSAHAEKPSNNKGDFVNSAPRIIGDILGKVGSLHWLGAGLSVIGYVLHTAHEMPKNRKICLDLLQNLVDLFDDAKKLKYRLQKEEDKLKRVERATMVIVKGCIMCSSQLCSHKLSSFLKASVNAEDLSSLREEINSLRSELTLTTVLEQGAVIHPQIPSTYPVHAVGLEEGKQEVIRLLQLTSVDTPPVAVVIYGFGGIGKTTLAEAVVATIKTDLNPYNYARVDFNIDSSKNDIKSLQEQILNGLFPSYTQGTKTELTSCSQGRAVLTEAFRKEGNKPIFLFIDNALRKQDLEELLPRDMKGLPKRSRILVTTRVLSATDMFIEAGLERQQYRVQPLSNQEAKIFLLKDSDDRQPGNIQEQDVDMILNICKGIPLVLKIVRGHFRKQGYRADKCSQILEKLRKGEQINEEDLSKTLTDFVYDQLEESTKQSFMDICCFFYKKNPSYVQYIVGEQDFTWLEEAGFVQRSDDNKTLIVHDIIRERGQNKAGLESTEPTRIMNVQSLIDATDQQRLKDIRGIWILDEPEEKRTKRIIRRLIEDEFEDEPEYVVEEQHLKAMTKLRVLAIGMHIGVSHRCEVTFKELRYLQVGGDIPCLPVNLERLPKLAFYEGPLFIEGFSIYKLPEKLRVLIGALQFDFNEARDSESSTSIRAVENCSLKELDLSESRQLQKVPPGLHLLTSLEILRWNGWIKRVKLPEEVCQLTRLTKLTLRGWTRLTCLPEGFGRLTALEDLNLFGCKALQCLPESFGGLKALKSLNLSYCWTLERLPESFGELTSLRHIYMTRCPARADLCRFEAKLKHVPLKIEVGS